MRKDLMITTVIEADGLLFIGDPHISSQRPGRRKDKDYPSVILAKLESALKLANERRLVPILLGDLYDRPKEEDEALKTRVIRCLRRAWMPPIALVGNHDKQHAVLTDGDSLAAIREAGVAHVVSQSGPIAVVSVDGRRLGIGGTPYKQDIPDDVTDVFPDADFVTWVTHHDIAFEKAYPGAQDPFEIQGCGLVVNGHMHLSKPTVQMGSTLWFNPGNITRQEVDAIAHVPYVWELNSAEGLVPHELEHEKDVFNLTGRLVEAVSPGEIPVEPAPDAEDKESVFVRLLQQEASTDIERTADGSVLREDIMRKFEREKTPEDVRAAVLALLEDASPSPAP